MDKMTKRIKTTLMILDETVGEDNIPTEKEIRDAVEQAALLFRMTDAEKRYVENQIQASRPFYPDLGTSVFRKATFHPWLASRKSRIDWYYWNRYAEFLDTEEGWAEETITNLDKVSDIILDLCGDPAEAGPWKRKGLVVGDVQSGKTANYLALSNKAADAKYGLIILLSGTIEGLRKQTQGRVDEGFVGLNSRNVLQKNPEKKYIGVGKVNKTRNAYPFTDVISDFNSSKLQALNFTIRGLNEPVILVVKKNKSVLENLATWIRTRNTDYDGEKLDIPLLLIDDEADNASINTSKPENKPTAINAAIVDILSIFNRSTYVAVTATPYANIFIDPELDSDKDETNLFPSDFIYALTPSDKYIGAKRIFGDDGDHQDCLEPINDIAIDKAAGCYVFKSKDRSAHVIPYIPDSLSDAIIYYLLMNAVLDLNGNTTSHRSMLINVSQFVNVQIQLFHMVEPLVDRIKRKIQAYSKLDYEEAITHKEIAEIKLIWDKFQLSKKTGYSFATVLSVLFEATSPVQVRLVNTKAKQEGVEKLDYEPYKNTGLRVIAIGGNGLSRGLTLEGLVVSYFCRNSQMYDTLLQMGRWFGYRPGYDRLFKIWMEPEVVGSYSYITRASEELISEINTMRKNDLTPRDFGLKVQQDKTSLFVTAKNKMRAATVIEQWVDVSGDLIETTRLISSRKKCLEENLITTSRLVNDLDVDLEVARDCNYRNRVVYKNVAKKYIVDYIRYFIAHPSHFPFNAKDLSDYIEGANDLDKWTVAVVGGSGELVDEKLPLSLRKAGIHYSPRIVTMNESCLLIDGQKARIGVPGATKIDLNPDVIRTIEEDWKRENPGKKTVNDKAYLATERDPILIIYPINIDEEQKPDRKYNSDEDSIKEVGDTPIICIALGFPGNAGTSRRVKYVINAVEQRNMNNYEEDSEDEED